MTQDRVEEVELLVVGGGKAGESLAMDRARAGWSVAMVERDKIGGSCINVACIPTKSPTFVAERTDVEVIVAVQMAMLGGLRHRQVRDAPITHPTMAEGLNLLLDAV
jgi:pyruvate/2-oxoglutarate dehydrogenase complex dihydrolipoamide dehydrogenase (E3) component